VLLRLEALFAKGYWGVPISPNAAILRQKREAAAKEVAEMNDLHQAAIALACADVVNCNIAARVSKKAVMVEISKKTGGARGELPFRDKLRVPRAARPRVDPDCIGVFYMKMSTVY
jgi:hypothetical protein